MDELSQLIEDIKKDTQIDDMNILEKQKMLPSKKHFWATKLILYKKEQIDLVRKRKTLITELVEKIIKESKVSISKQTAEKAVLESKQIKDIDNRLEELGFIIELLEKTEQIFKSMSFDIKNIIELNKMEQL